jgi:hypothetical protein
MQSGSLILGYEALAYKPDRSKPVVGSIPCSICGKILTYTSKFAFEVSLTKIVRCMDCQSRIDNDYTKICPKCHSLQIYTCQGSLDTALRRNCVCYSCSKKKWFCDEDRKISMRNACKRYKLRQKMLNKSK